MFEASLGYGRAYLKRKKKKGNWALHRVEEAKISVDNENQRRRDLQLSAAALCWDKQEMHFTSPTSTAGTVQGPVPAGHPVIMRPLKEKLH